MRPVFQWMPSRRAHEEAASGGMHGVDGVADEVAQDLPDLSFEAQDGADCAVALLYLNLRVDEASLVDGECAVDQVVAGDPFWVCWIGGGSAGSGLR